MRVLCAMLALVAAAAVGCGRGERPPGTVRLALTIPPSGPSVNAVDWRILSATNVVVRSGVIQTADPNATPSVDASCPAGSGYTVTLSATASDGTACLGASPAFNVASGATSPVMVTLVCGGSDVAPPGGSVIIGATVVAGDNCPVLTSWEVSPLRTSDGAPINVTATASDADQADVLAYRWTATSGTFAAPSAPTTVYVCSSTGRADLSVIVSDGHMPTPCTTARSFSVYCGEVGDCGNGIIEPGEGCDPPNGAECNAACQLTNCGDGIVGPGEQCDPPNATTCTSNCQFPQCGNGIIEPGEACDPPSSPGCNSSCQLAVCGDGIRDAGEECDPPNGTTCRPGCIAARCGDGVVDPGEQCDPPDGTTCGPTCQRAMQTAVCGNGIVEPGEQCDPPRPLSCTAQCQLECEGTVLSSCDRCEAADPADCPISLTTVPGMTCGWGCNGFGVLSQARADCEALLSCIVATKCMAGDDPTPCLCGALQAQVCASAGAPASAPCATQYAAAAADAPSTVFSQFSNPSTPVGIANNIAACDVDSACNCR